MTHELFLQRRYLKPDYTIGRLSIDDVSYCDVVEDAVRDYNKDGDLNDAGEQKIPKLTAIPYGRYRVVVTLSPKFRRELPLLLRVPHFEGIRIHGGSTAASSEGCLVVGENKIKGGVINSKKYVDELTSMINMWQTAKEETWITIV